MAYLARTNMSDLSELHMSRTLPSVVLALFAPLAIAQNPSPIPSAVKNAPLPRPSAAPSAQSGSQATPALAPKQAAQLPVRRLPIASMKMLSPTSGWASSGNRLFLTRDNGADWQDISPTTYWGDKFASIFFRDANTGSVLIAHSEDLENWTFTVSSTTDGGATWKVSALPAWPTDREHGVPGLSGSGILAFADGQNGWLSLDIEGNTLFARSALFSTSDGGATWVHSRTSPDVDIDGISAPSKTDLFISGHAGEGPELWASHDGGTSFQQIFLPQPAGAASDGRTLGSPIFPDPTHGYETATYLTADSNSAVAAFFVSSDAGRTWALDRTLAGLDGGGQIATSVGGGSWMVPFSPGGNQPQILFIDFACDSSTSKPCGGFWSLRAELSDANDRMGGLLRFAFFHDGWRRNLG